MAKKRPDCQTCGACCATAAWNDDQEPFVMVGDDDLERFTKKLGRRRTGALLTMQRPVGFGFCYTDMILMDVTRPPRVFPVPPRQKPSACAALKGAIGKKCSCSIYDVRPDACRDFEPGSEMCLEARKKLGLR